MEHKEDKGEEDRKTNVTVGDDTVDDVCHLICVASVTLFVSCLVECSVDKAILRIHDGSL